MAAALDERSAVIVAGDDMVAAGHAAIGIARAQARRRRVVVVDLVGELAPLQSLITEPDPIGVSDTLRYGVSLSKAAHRVSAAGNFHVMPSGTEPVADADILGDGRWRRIAAGFRESHGLLLLVANRRAPSFEVLAESAEGIVVVGEARMDATLHVIERIRVPAEPSGVELPAAVEASAEQASTVAAPDRVRELPNNARSLRRAAMLLGAAIVLVAALWLLRGRGNAASRNSPVAPASGVAANGGATAPAGSSAGSAPRVALAAGGDSANAAAYAVELLSANTRTGAMLKLRDAGDALPAGTFAPVMLGDGTRWFRVLAGASREAAGADTLLASLRRDGLLEQGGGAVVRAPFALLVRTGVAPEAAPRLVAGLGARGLPVYALLQSDGTATLYAGAFEEREQAGVLAEALRSDGIESRIVYRTGRPFR
ncbi:MAG: hypothetical protein ACRENI_02080 [Gemmatimonadaceae bacterium]